LGYRGKWFGIIDEWDDFKLGDTKWRLNCTCYFSHPTWHHGKVISTPASCSEGPRFKSWLGDRQSWLNFSLFSSALPHHKQMLG
jgi:hypothetical protein